MKFDELLFKRMAGDKMLAAQMVTYLMLPAIFYQNVPDDTDIGWKDKQYPRICFDYNLQADIERKTAGKLCVSVFCVSNEDVMPVRVESEVKRVLKDIILTPDELNPYCLTWSKSEYFDIGRYERKDSDTMICGVDVYFDIIEYPSQETTSPDPVVGLNCFLKNLYPSSYVIGLDRLPDIIDTNIESPVIYSRLDISEKENSTNTVVWFSARIAVHVLCSDNAVRKKLVMAIANTLSVQGEIILLDKSPMTVTHLKVSHTADYLTQGQLNIFCRYGILKPCEKKHVLIGGKIITNY